jgi:hypothetical protein
MTDIHNFRQFGLYVVIINGDNSIELQNRHYLPLGLTKDSQLEGFVHIKPVLSEHGINALKELASINHDGNRVYIFDSDLDSPDIVPRTANKKDAYFAKLNAVYKIIYGW